MDILHQLNVVGVIDRHVDQGWHRLLQGIPKHGAKLVGMINRIALRAKGFRKFDHVVVTQLDAGDPPVVGLLLELHHVVRITVPDHVHKAAAHTHGRFQFGCSEQKAPVARHGDHWRAMPHHASCNRPGKSNPQGLLSIAYQYLTGPLGLCIAVHPDVVGAHIKA